MQQLDRTEMALAGPEGSPTAILEDLPNRGTLFWDAPVAPGKPLMVSVIAGTPFG